MTRYTHKRRSFSSLLWTRFVVDVETATSPVETWPTISRGLQLSLGICQLRSMMISMLREVGCRLDWKPQALHYSRSLRRISTAAWFYPSTTLVRTKLNNLTRGFLDIERLEFGKNPPGRDRGIRLILLPVKLVLLDEHIPLCPDGLGLNPSNDDMEVFSNECAMPYPQVYTRIHE